MFVIENLSDDSIQSSARNLPKKLTMNLFSLARMERKKKVEESDG
jgi:hypothetical protein